MTEPSPEVVALAQSAVLDSVEFWEMSIVRNEDPQEPVDAEGRMSMDIQVKDLTPGEDRGFRYAMTAAFRNHEGEVKVRPAATYHVQAEHAGLLDDPAIAVEYGNRVAVMTLLPFAREAIATLSSRVFEERILMPIFTASQIRFSAEDAENPQTPSSDDEPD